MTTYIKPTRIIADNAFLKRITTRAKNYQEALKGLAIEAAQEIYENNNWGKYAACLKAGGGYKDFFIRAGIGTNYNPLESWEDESKRLASIEWKVKKEVVRVEPEQAVIQFLTKKMDAKSVQDVPGLSARIQRALDAFLASEDEE